MGSLRKEHDRNRVGWRLQFYTHDRRRRSLWLGDIGKRSAEQIARHVDELLNCSAAAIPPRAETAKWLADAPDRIAKRLISYGIASEADRRIQGDEGRLIAAFMDAYIASRDDWKRRSKINYTQARDWLVKYTGKSKPMRDFTQSDGERWHRWLISDGGLAATTASQHVKRCRQMLKVAVRDGLIPKNPLEGVKTAPDCNRDKDFYVTPEIAKQLIEEAPNPEWRLIIALVRYAGLRCPSEVLRLRWTDVLWDKSRVIVSAPKTERYAGKDQRVLPIFPQLLPHLKFLFDEVQPGTKVKENAFVIRQYRAIDANLRTELNRIIRRTGNQPWEKPFINMRASCRTELENTGKYATHVLNAWFGHSTAIAHKHYLQVADEDYNRAVGKEEKANGGEPAQEAIDASSEIGTASESQDDCGDICGATIANQGNSDNTAEVGTPIKNPCLTPAAGVEHGYQYTPEDSNL